MIETVSNWKRPREGLILPPWYPRARPKYRRKQEGILWVPQKGIMRVEHNLGNVGNLNPGTAVTTGAASSTKGTPAQIFASTAFDAYWVEVLAYGYSASATTSQGCLDILIGAATEEVLIPNLLMGFCPIGLNQGPKRWSFPLYIPAGSRIAARAAGDRVNTIVRVIVSLYGGNGCPPFRPGGKVTTYGITTVPAGTDVAAGYSAAEGAWVEIAAATSEDHFCFAPSFHPTDDDTTLTPSKGIAMDIGIGAATEEALLGTEQSYFYIYDTAESCHGPINAMPAFQDVPSGTRLVARLSMSGTTDTGEPDCAIHALS